MTDLCVIRQTVHSFYTRHDDIDNSERQMVSEKNVEKGWFPILKNVRKKGYS